MPYKKKQAIPGTARFKKFIAELPEKRKRIKHKLNLEIIFENHRNGLITRTTSIDCKGLKK